MIEKQKVIGYLRFDLQDDKLEISIALDVNNKSKGLGSYLLSQSLKQHEPTLRKHKIIAEVKQDNIASNKFFEKNKLKTSKKKK